MGKGAGRSTANTIIDKVVLGKHIRVLFELWVSSERNCYTDRQKRKKEFQTLHMCRSHVLLKAVLILVPNPACNSVDLKFDNIKELLVLL